MTFSGNTWRWEQDTTKKASPIIEHDRVGFGDDAGNDHQENSAKPPDKRAPFNSGVIPGEKKQDKKDKKKNSDKTKRENTEKNKKEEEKKKEKEKEKKQKEEKEEEQKRNEEQTNNTNNQAEILQAENARKDSLKRDSVENAVIAAKRRTEAIALYKKNSLIAKPRHFVNQDGLFLLFLLIAGLFGWINIFHRRRFIQVINSFFITRYINQLIREENSLLQRVFVMVSILFILIFSIFVFQTSQFYHLQLPNAGPVFLFVVCMLIVALVYFSKFLIINFTGYLFDDEKTTKEYFYNIFLINNFIGILLVPVVIGLAYMPLLDKSWLITLGIGIYSLSFAYRVFRGFIIGWNNGGYTIIHIFLYLCTLEILPLILTYKLLIGLIH